VARKKRPESRKAKKARIDLFGPPSLLYGESEDAYNELFERVNEALKPADIFEEFAARDLANAMMDSVRFARLKPELLKGNMRTGLERVLKPLLLKFPTVSADSVAAKYVAGDKNAIEIVEGAMILADLSMDAVVAETLSYEMSGFEAIDRLETSAQSRRYSILREIERRRESKQEAPLYVARVSKMAAIGKVRANDNEKPSEKNDDGIEIEMEQTNTAGAPEAIERKSKAVGG
jgi:CheY-like chemotaxis protein